MQTEQICKTGCGGEKCNKCCQGQEKPRSCPGPKGQMVTDGPFGGKLITISTRKGTTFGYDDSDIQAIEKMLVQMQALGISPKEIQRIQIVRQGTPHVFTIRFSGAVSRRTGEKTVMVACRHADYRSDRGQNRPKHHKAQQRKYMD